VLAAADTRLLLAASVWYVSSGELADLRKTDNHGYELLMKLVRFSIQAKRHNQWMASTYL